MKKNFHLIILFFFALGLLTISGCSKKNNSPAHVTPTKTNLVGSYQYTAETAKSGSSAKVNVFATFDACAKDDVVKLNADLSINFIDAGAACTPPNNDTETWDLPNSTTLTIGTDSYTIKSFDGKTLILTFTDNGSTPSVLYTITIVKQ